MSAEQSIENPPAFPVLDRLDGGLNHYNVVDYDVVSTSGMSLRDYFAAKAMAVANLNGKMSPANIAAEAYAIADAMLKARGKS